MPKLTHLTAASLLALAATLAGPGSAEAGCTPSLTSDSTDSTCIGTGALASNQAGGIHNTAAGMNALNQNTTGSRNTASGSLALQANTTGSNNTASGSLALQFNTTGQYNTASGAYALNFNTTGRDNTASGSGALYFNTTGSYNIALGRDAGSNLTTGSNNIAIGNAGVAAEAATIRIGTAGTQTRAFMAGIAGTPLSGGQTVVIGADGQLGVAPAATVIPGENITMIGTGALASNQAGGINNTAAGMNALNQNTTGGNNTASGMNALNRNSTGGSNTASGVSSLQQNTTGNNNTASGVNALNQNTTGGNNTASGAGAMFANTAGSNNTALGFEAGKNWTMGSNNIAIGNAGVAAEEATIRIGTAGTQTRAFMAGIAGTPLSGGQTVVISADGQLGVAPAATVIPGENVTMIGTGALASNQALGVNNTAAGVSALNKNTTGGNNTASGYQALFNNQTGDNNTAHGVAAMLNATGSNNIALGFEAGKNLTTGNNNIAIGNVGAASDDATIRIGTAGTQSRAFMAGIAGTPLSGGQAVVVTADGQLGVAPATTPIPGENVTMIGAGALASNQALGVNNTAAGVNALNQNTTGINNTAAGMNALNQNTTGINNTAAGMNALNQNTTGGNNTASGMNALNRNSTGGSNTASGVSSLQQNTTGNNNTASGVNALNQNTTGGNNTASGAGAMFANTAGSNNTALGFEAGKNWTTGSNNIAIGHAGVGGESNTIRIGGVQNRVFFSGIYATKVTKTRPVLINANGQLGTSRSSLRYKEDVQSMGDASNALMDLRPVTYRYKQAEADGSKPIQYGLIAEEVDKVMPDLVVYDEQGRPDSVSYEILPSLLLNEVQKQNRELVATKAELAETKAQLAETKATFEAELAALKLAVSRLAAAPAAVKVAASQP